MWDIEVDVFVIEESCLECFGSFVEGTVHDNLETGATVVWPCHVEATGDEMVVVVGVFEAADVFF